MKRILWLFPCIALFTGCASPTLYTWGNYENLIYASYAAPGKIPPEMQVETLEHDYQKARAKNKRMPPGWHAHLGSLYYQLGRLDQAQQEFNTEKAEYPESARFMDHLLTNLENK